MRVAFELEALTPAVLRALLAGLVVIDMEYLAQNPGTPRLYAAGVRYVREGARREVFQDLPTTLERGIGDCEDLSAWRVAELRAAGENARPAIKLRMTENGPLFHVLVRRGNGKLEDPSRRLGMVTL